jgi:hypothetical protein
MRNQDTGVCECISGFKLNPSNGKCEVECVSPF